MFVRLCQFQNWIQMPWVFWLFWQTWPPFYTPTCYVCKINTKISLNVIIMTMFKTNDVTHPSPKNKISECHMTKSRSKMSTLASSISANIHLAHPGHAQNESIRLSQQNGAKISHFCVCAISWKLPAEAGIFYWHVLEVLYTNIVYWIYLC